MEAVEYTARTMLRLAKRRNNKKRTYLLVNPLQGKHLPVSPTVSLTMMEHFGRRLAARCPGTKLVIGFAETATAVAAAAARCAGEDCIYIHTTREESAAVKNWICFQEEHSHAVEQKLCGDSLARWSAASPEILLIDDELSTGKTMRNIAVQLRAAFPELESKPFAAASLLNRLTPEHSARLREAGISEEYLLKLPLTDYTEAVAGYDIVPAEPPEQQGAQAAVEVMDTCAPLQDPRRGVTAGPYAAHCEVVAAAAVAAVREQLPRHGRVLVLGTEECMYPALVLGKAIEETHIAVAVRCHATTRSPIGICTQPGYPITSGVRLPGFYDAARETYLYQLDAYDLAIVLTDAAEPSREALDGLAQALGQSGCGRLIVLRGGNHV